MKSKKIIIKTLIVLLLVLSIHEITFVFDTNAIGKGNRSSFALDLVRYKDGGSVEYYGLGYQVLRWHQMLASKRKIAEEIYRFPFFKKWSNGPKSTTQYFDYQP